MSMRMVLRDGGQEQVIVYGKEEGDCSNAAAQAFQTQQEQSGTSKASSAASKRARAPEVPAAAIVDPVPSESDEDSDVPGERLPGERASRLLARRTAEAAKLALAGAVHRPCNRASAIALHAEGSSMRRYHLIRTLRA